MISANRDIFFQPLGGYVLVEQIPHRQTGGGIALPENAQTHGEPPKARVVAVGPGEETEMGHRREMPVKVGDVIYMYFPHYASPVALTINGKKYALAQAKYICGRIKS